MCVLLLVLQVYDKKVHPNLDALQLDGAYPFERTKRGAIVWGFAKPGDKSVSSLQPDDAVATGTTNIGGRMANAFWLLPPINLPIRGPGKTKSTLLTRRYPTSHSNQKPGVGSVDASRRVGLGLRWTLNKNNYFLNCGR